MESKTKVTDYKTYLQKVARKQVSFACPDCGDRLLPREFEAHCCEKHRVDPKLACVWCRGEISWSARKKNENAAHLLECFENFIGPREVLAAEAASRLAATVNEVPTRACRALPLDEKLARERDYFGRRAEYVVRRLPRDALEWFSPLQLDAPTIPYTDDNLNLAVSCVDKYLATRETHDWFHVIVRAVAFKSFFDALDRKCRFLPFWCWCDGGPYDEPRHRQHRHMIATAPKDHFLTEIWPRVRADDRPCANFPAKEAKRIAGPLHLVNTLGYLSRRRSGCQFSTNVNKKKQLRNNHFYIFKTLPVNYKLPLAVLWIDGLRELMYLIFFQNASMKITIEKKKVIKDDGQWKQQIKYFYKLVRGFALPLDRRYAPTERKKTEHRVYLLSGRPLYFERKYQEPPDEETWIEDQVAGKNCFYENVGDEFWVPRPKFQKILNLVMPRIYEIDLLNEEIERQKKKNEEQNDKIRELYEGRIADLQKRLEKCNCITTQNNNNNCVIFNQ